MSSGKLKAGDWVRVKSPREISATLDSEGTLDSLPFMPEMLEFCGRTLRVLRLAEKTCVEYPGGNYNIREFKNNDAVLLDIPRCSGADHDGCQRSCVFFWKSAWLEKVAKTEPSRATDPAGLQDLRRRLKTTTDPVHYFCQSTQLDKSTLPLTRSRVLLKCLYDVKSGSRGIIEMFKLVAAPIWFYFVKFKVQPPLAVGTLKKTPVLSLELQPGELVKIKTEAEILQTLDHRGRNRGLSCDRGMRQYCGETFKVRSRLDRMISEVTGEMRKVESTVMLDGLQCICWWNHVGGCPREDYMYWREGWLERQGQSPEKVAEPVESIKA